MRVKLVKGTRWFHINIWYGEQLRNISVGRGPRSDHYRMFRIRYISNRYVRGFDFNILRVMMWVELSN